MKACPFLPPVLGSEIDEHFNLIRTARIMRDKSEGPNLDATEMYARFMQEWHES